MSCTTDQVWLYLEKSFSLSLHSIFFSMLLLFDKYHSQYLSHFKLETMHLSTDMKLNVKDMLHLITKGINA